MADSRTFNTTPETLMDLAEMLASHGITCDPTRPSGEVKSGEWDLTWTTPQPNQITLTVLKHPFAEEGIMWGKVQGLFGPAV